MIKERKAKIDSIFEAYRDSQHAGLGWEHRDPNTGEICAVALPKVGRSNTAMAALESEGFAVIFPAPLSEEEVKHMNESDRYAYEAKLQDGLVVDKKSESCLSGNLLHYIADYYYSLIPSRLAGEGTRGENYSVTEFKYLENAEDTNANYCKMMAELGFDTIVNENGSVTVIAKAPYVNSNAVSEDIGFSK